MMTKEDVIARLRCENRAVVARATGLRYGYLSKLAYDEIKNPGFVAIDKLRSYFLLLDAGRKRPRRREPKGRA